MERLENAIAKLKDFYNGLQFEQDTIMPYGNNEIIIGWLEELKAYKDAEKQGLLLKPKVALGSFVYCDSVYWGVIPYKVCNISYSIHGFCYVICAFKGDELLDDQEVVDDDFGKFVFLTKEEAEKIKENEHGRS